MEILEFERDEEKNEINKRKHGIDFNNRRGKSRLLVSGMKAPSI